MKKKIVTKKRLKFLFFFEIILLLMISLSIYLCYPVYWGGQMDGGTKIWKAKIYTLVKWNKLTQYDDDGNVIYMPEPNGWKVYWWPNQDEWMYL